MRSLLAARGAPASLPCLRRCRLFRFGSYPIVAVVKIETHLGNSPARFFLLGGHTLTRSEYPPTAGTAPSDNFTAWGSDCLKRAHVGLRWTTGSPRLWLRDGKSAKGRGFRGAGFVRLLRANLITRRVRFRRSCRRQVRSGRGPCLLLSRYLRGLPHKVRALSAFPSGLGASKVLIHRG